MISFEEFKIELGNRSTEISTPCYICGTPHKMHYICSSCWITCIIPKFNDSQSNLIGVELVYKMIQDIQAEIIEQELLLGDER